MVRNLEKEHQLAVAAAVFQAPPVHFDFHLRHQPLMKCELGAHRRYHPSERSLAVLAEPLLEGDFLERRIIRSALAGSLGQ
jgi:hypothetical protein